MDPRFQLYYEEAGGGTDPLRQRYKDQSVEPRSNSELTKQSFMKRLSLKRGESGKKEKDLQNPLVVEPNEFIDSKISQPESKSENKGHSFFRGLGKKREPSVKEQEISGQPSSVSVMDRKQPSTASDAGVCMDPKYYPFDASDIDEDDDSDIEGEETMHILQW